MFEKILIANRGEIALRVIRTCRDMGIRTVAVYTPIDRNALHVRLADEAIALTAALGYRDADGIIAAAQQTGAQAIHPGYGFLAEVPSFAQACAAAGIVFIGPPAEQLATFQDKIGALQAVRAAGFATPAFSEISAGPEDDAVIADQAAALGFPLVVKSCSGGRGRATRLVFQPDQLAEQVRQARREGETFFGGSRLYLEHAIAPARLLAVQVVGDAAGTLVHLGERHGLPQRHVQKLIQESPAPNLSEAQRADLHRTALEIARLFGFRGVGSVEFLMDRDGGFHFTEVKPRITVDHPVTEILTRIDLVRTQIELAAGDPVRIRQADVQMRGVALQCQVRAEDPWNHYLPSPGVLRTFRVPGGAYVRVDSYGCSGCTVPVQYDPLLAKVVVWGESRDEALRRMRRALDEFAIRGVRTNSALLHQVLDHDAFVDGSYDTSLLLHALPQTAVSTTTLRDLAIAAAVAIAGREESSRPVMPAQLLSGWHRSSRDL